ncbi:hypothetical protein PTD2_18460 [Pseudoalteromonas tunicata D2]|uniref:Uncharacterized protein n=1 Tax=Pseudoalteromonas tunicata D2 TaxID=87626 RepID=A4CBU5_9GAMM|nr:hypothetical protein PTD2_18460 [Pseudoalteromonas tunicata D2]
MNHLLVVYTVPSYTVVYTVVKFKLFLLKNEQKNDTSF